MRYMLLAIFFGVLVVGRMTLAGHGEHAKSGVKVPSQKEIIEKIDGKRTKGTTVEVTWRRVRPVRRTTTPAQCSVMSFKGSTSGPSTTTLSR